MRLLTIKQLSGVKEAAGRVKNFKKRKRKTAPPVARQSRFPKKFLHTSREVPGNFVAPGAQRT